MERIKKIVALIFLIFGITANAQDQVETKLYQILKKNDSILFNAAFNTCEIEILQNLFTEDFEFYHDKGGMTEGRELFLSQIAQGCQNRDLNKPQPAKRHLVKGSLEVYPMYKNNELYAAIQHGEHTFEFLNETQEYQKGDIAKFTHVWVLDEGNWKIKREISYDHQLQN